MSKIEFLNRLADQTWESRLQGDAYTVLAPNGPIDADELWLAAADDDEIETYSEAMEILPIRTVVTFWWDDGFPASAADIEVFATEDRTYVTRPNDDLDFGWVILAAIEPRDSEAGFHAFLADYLSDNGDSYGAEIFGGLPTRIESFDPQLASREAIRDAIAAWRDWVHADWSYELPDGGQAGSVDSYIEKAYEIGKV